MVAAGNAVEVWGQIKWFDPARGFGFINSDEGGPDILLHANVLRNFGRSSVIEGARIHALVTQTERGKQAVEVLEVLAPDADAGAAIPDLAGRSCRELSSLPLRPARVKWFDKSKGFGFANVFGEAEDVFLHIEVLRRYGFSDLVAGEAVALRVMDGQRGPMAAMLAHWDAGHAEAAAAVASRAGAEHLDGRPRLVASAP